MCTDERVVKTFKDQKTESKEGDVGDTKETRTALEAEKKSPQGESVVSFYYRIFSNSYKIKRIPIWVIH